MDKDFDPYGEAAADCPHKAMHANAEGLTGMRGEPISQADYDELSPTQLRGLRALNAERTRLARFAIYPREVSVTKGPRDFGKCTRCDEPLDHRCQYTLCEACLQVTPTYPTAADFDRLDKRGPYFKLSERSTFTDEERRDAGLTVHTNECHVEDGCSVCGDYVIFRPVGEDDGRHQHYDADGIATTDWVHIHADNPEALVGYEGCHPDLTDDGVTADAADADTGELETAAWIHDNFLASHPCIEGACVVCQRVKG